MQALKKRKKTCQLRLMYRNFKMKDRRNCEIKIFFKIFRGIFSEWSVLRNLLPPSSAYIGNYLITYITIIRNDIISCLCISLVFLTLRFTFKHFEDQCFNLFLLDILTNTSHGLPIKHFKIWQTIIPTSTNVYTIYECFCLVDNELVCGRETIGTTNFGAETQGF